MSSAQTWRPVSPRLLTDEIVAGIAARPGTVRVAIDGPPCAEPLVCAQELVEPLRVLGRPAVVVDARFFWRDASVRLEHGRTDVESYLSWLDHDALQREVLEPAITRHEYLPSLRDPDTNRSTHATPQTLGAHAVVVVAGSLLLGRGSTFDYLVHLAVSPAALARRTPAESAWTLAAFTEYDETVQPRTRSDVVVKLDDPAHPAVRA